MSDSAKQPKARASDHESYNTYSLLSFLLPLVGLIMGAVMLTKEDKVDRKLGEHAIVVSIIGSVVWAILYTVYVNWAATQAIQDIQLY